MTNGSETDITTALALHRESDLARAEAAYRHLVSRQPDLGEAQLMLATLLHQTGRSQESLGWFARAFISAPGDHRLHHNLGEALRALGRHQDAEACFRIAEALEPGFVEAITSHGAALAEMGRLGDAISALRRALDLAPGHGRAKGNLALALLQSGAVTDSLPLFDAAVAASPDSPILNWNRALARLLVGDYAAGLPALEWRWRVPGFPSPTRDFPQQRWRGEPFPGRRLLLHAEQGFGDSLQFLRYAPMAAARGGAVILEIQQPLLALAAGTPGCAEIVPQGGPLPAFDLHCPLMSLPEIFETRLETIPTGPYLRADPARVAAWRARLPRTGKRRVGLVWSGNAAYGADARRSLPPDLLAPLATIPNIAWVSLQVGRAGPLPFPMIDLAPDLADFSETAAALLQLDLLITVDTAIAHLAGAMGFPAWVLLAHPPDWRWLLDRDDTPWHPALKVYRQPGPGDWEAPIARIAADLAALAAPTKKRK